ncbi:hypothetical protein M422DRAFT_270011 [Sphaerobolus stellatus SS14]|uniref:Uncharacterized protein n=1 Tax=Sphaerobolus stellatus (strain SS14) TaxID=990650 RepID=A0A0C9U3C2_SPHS4|nr:hypothetical protein M422DRAFT_270011 [Sphaerobolus stellatus SS14]
MDIKQMWQQLCLPHDMLEEYPDISHGVTFGVQHRSHWFAVVFKQDFQEIYVYNHIFLSSEQVERVKDEWETWSGPQLWTLVSDLVGWDTVIQPKELDDFYIKSLSWYGNGSDCGPEMIQVLLELILENGVVVDEDTQWPLKPDFTCSHLFREQMLHEILISAQDSYFVWKSNHTMAMLEVQHYDNDIIMEDIQSIFEDGLDNQCNIQETIKLLTRL